MNSRLHEFGGYRLAVNCGTATCGGERVYAVADLARMHGPDKLMGVLVVHMRCHRCGGRAVSCFIETGPELAQRGRMRRMALIGPERGDVGR